MQHVVSTERDGDVEFAEAFVKLAPVPMLIGRRLRTFERVHRTFSLDGAFCLALLLDLLGGLVEGFT